jgi:hypothetical protein
MTYLIKEQRTRFIYPFSFKPLRQATQLIAALETLRYREKPVWQQVEPHHLYTRETLDLVNNFLFRGEQGGGTYFKVTAEVATTWFKNGVTVATRRENLTAKLETLAGIELFISPQSVGILSIALEAVSPTDLDSLKKFNYRLAQAREYETGNMPKLLLPPNPNQSPPSDEAPLVERLGVRGGKFTMVELRDFLLSPVQTDLTAQKVLEQFLVYTVVRFDQTADFTQAQVQADLKPLLCGLAHLEEHTHVGSLELLHQVMNPRHWLGLGALGVAHLVADQEPAHDFNNQRVPNVLNKYFIPYLCALFQRLLLRGMMEDASKVVQKYGTVISGEVQEAFEAFKALHHRVLNFTVTGYFTEISQREVQNQCYRLTQAALQVPAALELVQRTLNDINATNLADKLERNVAVVTSVQKKVEWLEVFFVSFYATELVHLITEAFGFAPNYAQWSTIFWPIFAGGMTFWGLKPHSHREKESSYLPAIILLVGAVLWFGVGWWWFGGSRA